MLTSSRIVFQMENKNTCASHSALLNEFWDKGLRSLGSAEMKSMAGEVMTAIGLLYIQIKVSAVYVKFDLSVNIIGIEQVSCGIATKNYCSYGTVCTKCKFCQNIFSASETSGYMLVLIVFFGLFTELAG